MEEKKNLYKLLGNFRKKKILFYIYLNKRMVGRQHCQVKQLSFTAARWLSFKTSMIETFANQKNGKLKTQWSLLISFLIYEIKDAYLAHVN